LTDFPFGRKSLYVITRLLRPMRVVETGVWFGFFTSQILQALHDNGEGGRLYSVDVPNMTYEVGSCLDAKMLLDGRGTGFVIPPALLGRWEPVGLSKDVLVPLLERIGQIDLFFHDSEHTYENQLFGYRVAWRYLRPGGVLVSDDVHLNRSFRDFSLETGARGYICGEYGRAIKDVPGDL
jgi:predicted O-methyltransferase YrrM